VKAGTHYYRLKQTDFNGDNSYSHIEEVNFNEEEEYFMLYPNPLTNSNSIQLLTGNILNQVNISFYDCLGRIIKNTQIDIDKMNSSYEIYFEEKLSKGIYSVIINSREKIFHQKLIIQ
jgi:folate-dependent tRNA-U54 methylase TrmFO/GidA